MAQKGLDEYLKSTREKYGLSNDNSSYDSYVNNLKQKTLQTLTGNYNSYLGEINDFAKSLGGTTTGQFTNYADYATGIGRNARTTLSDFRTRNDTYNNAFKGLLGDAYDPTNYNSLAQHLTELSDAMDQVDLFYKKQDPYSKYSSRDDWESLSKYTPDKGDAYNDVKWSSLSYGDPKMMYDAVNGNEVKSKYAGKTWFGDQDVYDAMKYMPDYQRQVFNYIYSTQGPQDAARFLDEIMPTLNAEQRATREKEAQEWAAQSPWNKVLASAQSILMSPLKIVGYGNQIADWAENGEIDQNAGYNKYTYLQQSMRNAVSQDMNSAGNFLYQTGMSIGDFLLNAAITGNFGNLAEGGQKVAEVLSLGLMGTGAAADAVVEARDNGMSSNAALGLGTVAGIAEIVTERYSIEKLLDPNRVTDGTLKYIIKNILSEGLEEAGSDVINNVADDLLTVFTEEPTRLRRDLESGKSWWTILGERLGEAGLDALGGAISGGVMAGAGSGLDYVRQTNTGRNILANGNDYSNLYNLAMNMPDTSAANQYAQNFTDQAPQGLPAGNFLNRMVDEATGQSQYGLQQMQNSRNVGRLAEMTQYEMDQMFRGAETAANAVEAARNGKKLTPKLINEIRENRYAKQSLEVDENAKKRDVIKNLEERATAQIAKDKSDVKKYSESLGNIGAQVLVQMYEDAAPTQSALEYLRDAVKYYDAAVNGEEYKYDKDGTINEVQAKALYEAGQADIQGGTINAETRKGVLHAGVQGNDSAGAGVEARGVEEGSGRNQTRSEGRPEPSGPVGVVYEKEWVNSKNIGITGGVDGDTNLRKVASGESDGMRRVREEAGKRGLNVVWFGGGNLEVKRAGGTVAKARAAIDGETNTLYVRVDHSQFSAEMLGFHELAHDMINKGEIDIQEAAAEIQNSMKPEEFRQMLDDYAKLYSRGFTDEQIWTEIVCDSIGGMNSFALRGTEMRDKYAPVLSSVRASATNTARVEPVANVNDMQFSEEVAREYAETGNTLDLSQVTMYDAMGLEADRDGSGKTTFKTPTGETVTKVTPEYIRDHSAVGTLIKAAKKSGFFTEDERFKNPDGTLMTADQQEEEQYKAAADLMNTIIKTNDPDMVWAYTGATMFSALKQNSDGQYVTTVDFTTVCRKTVEIVNAMSKAMTEKAKKTGGRGGLTKGEVIRIQKELAQEGADVPCPVCYVFSRWAGIGGMFDEIYDLQEKYAGYTPAQLQKRTKELRDQIVENGWATKNKKGEYTVTGKAISNLGAKKDTRRSKVEFEINKYEIGESDISEAQYNKYKDELKSLNEDLGILGEWTWTSQIASDPQYKRVPSNILYDLNAGEAFARDYSVVWSYRTTRGPARGKAILPYSPMRYGDIILGAKASPEKRGIAYDKSGKSAGVFEKKTKERPEGTPILGKDGNFTRAQEKEYKSALSRARAQNLIGGHRYQSTSDFRYEYALDYLLSFWELQSLGGKMQTYTKVVEFADMVAAIGGDVNLSVMPFEKGYDDDGNLVFSNVTGMNIDAAKEANAKFDNAQLILVGINDENIRIALDDESGHGGEFIGFVIPYHSSGASKEDFISKLVGNLGETFNTDYYQDYSAVQNDKFRPDVAAILSKIKKDLKLDDNDKAYKAFISGKASISNTAVAAQLMRQALRTKMLTGDHGKRNTFTEDELNIIRGKSVDISDRSFEDLRAIEKKALAGDRAALKEYLSWSAGLLDDLYEKMYNGEEKDTFLTGDQAEKVMPHEYWNKKVDRKHAYVNNFIFRSYCYSMGLQPRFTGNNAVKESDRFGEFSDSKGYWKTLIDRPMYDNKGRYREQQRINLTNFNNAMLSPDYAKQTYPDYYKDNSKQGIGFEVGERFAAQNFSEVTDEELIKELDSGETVEVYRSMQIHNGELYPPIAAKYKDENGKWQWKPPVKKDTWYKSDEDLNQISYFVEREGRQVGKILLNKGNGSSPLDVLYNPYNHSTKGALNDQFMSAFDRPELVLVKALVPKWEINGDNPYWAEYAANHVGETDWREGPISKKLDDMGKPRKVILSQYIKIIKVLTPAEQAEAIAKDLDGVDVPFPVNTVTPAVRKELEKLGMKFAPPQKSVANKFYRMNPDVKFSEEVDTNYAVAQKLYEGKNLYKDKDLYDYDFLTSLPPMKITNLPSLSTLIGDNGRIKTRLVVDLGLQNAVGMGGSPNVKASVKNNYTGRSIEINSSSIRHSLGDNAKRMITNSKIGSVIGDVERNSVPINGLRNRAENVAGTYAMACYAVDPEGREFVAISHIEQRDNGLQGLELYDVAHSVNGRIKKARGTRASTKEQGLYPITSASGTITIADFLSVVNETHRSVLSDDVLNHYNEERPETGTYTGEVLFSEESDRPYAPTFYSKLEREVENFKGDKIGAASAVQYLKGKGVKDDEIKWSGIIPFLEGKKSVSKAELLDYLKANRLDVREEVLGDNGDGSGIWVNPYGDTVDTSHYYSDDGEEFANADDFKLAAQVLASLGEYTDDLNIVYDIDEVGGSMTAYVKEPGLDRVEILRAQKPDPFELRDSEYVPRGAARWKGYSTNGGGNYREYVYSLPGESYINNAMDAHWGKPGVIAHARVQDMTANAPWKDYYPYAEALFIDEIQSDWHNAGAKYGYKSTAPTDEQAKRAAEVANARWRLRHQDAIKAFVNMAVEEYDPAFEIVAKSYVKDDIDGEKQRNELIEHYSSKSALEKTTPEKVEAYVDAVITARNALDDYHHKQDVWRNLEEVAPDAPFKTTYTEFVLKNLLRKAAERGYDYLAWTPSEMQLDRWNPRRWSSKRLTGKGSDRDVAFQKGYQTEYDQQIPSFLKRFGKQFGAKIVDLEFGSAFDGNEFTAPALEITEAMRDSVLYSGQPMFSEETDELEDLQKRNQELRTEVAELTNMLKRRTEQKEYWKGQTKITEKPTIRPEDAKRIAKELAKAYNADVDLTEDMKKLGESVLADVYNMAFTDEDISTENITARAKDQAIEVAQKLLEASKELNDRGFGDVWKGIKQTLKNTKIYVPDSIKSDISGDYNEWRKSMFGTMTLTSNDKSAQKIDELYAELRDQYGDYLFPDSITHEAEMLVQIADVIQDFKPVMENMSAYDIANAVEYVADELVQRVLSYDVRETEPTFADKMQAKIDEERKQGKLALRRARIQRDRALNLLRQHHAQVAMDARTRKADSAARTRLLKIARRLNNLKLPAVNREYLKSIIGDLDLVAKGIAKPITDLHNLREEYKARQEQYAKEGYIYKDDAIEKKIGRLEKRQINSLTQEEVAELTEVLLHFENEYRTQKKAIESQMKHDFYVAGVKTMEDVNQSVGIRNQFLDKYVVTQTLTPEREMRRLTGYIDNDPLYILTKELSTGQRNAQDYTMKAYGTFTPWTDNKKFMERITGKKAEEITVKAIDAKTGEETTVKITPAMRISLYLHSLNEDNLRHVVNGGVNIPDITLYKKGKIEEAYKADRNYRFTPQMLREISAGMTDEERSLAKAINRYFNTTSRDAINRTSELLKGYSIASVENYFPIDTNKSFLNKDFDEIKHDGSIEGMGFTKERVKASNPIMLYDATTVLNKSISQHAKYVGLAIPVRNFNRLWNVKMGNGVSESVQGDIDAKWGKHAVNYVAKMMKDVQMQSFASDDFSEAFAKLRSRYAAAVLSLNASVAMKQAASYPTAAAVVGWKPLMKALKDGKPVDVNLIARYTPDYWYRAQGFSTQELGDIVKQGKTLPKVLNWIQGVDLLTTRTLWKAAEYYVQETSNERVGTDAYYKEVANVYNRIIEETQPNYTTMQRPQVLRSEADLTRALNMFKTQPFQNFNILYDAFENYRAKVRQNTALKSEESARALAQAKVTLARALSSQAVSALVFALMQFLWDWWRKKDKKYANKDGEITFASALGGLGLNTASNVSGMVPFGGTLLELGESLTDTIIKAFDGNPVFNQSFYGLSESGTEAINDAADTIIRLTKSIADVVKSDDETKAETFLRSIVDISGDIAQVAGVPANNVVNLLTSIVARAGHGVGLIEGGKYVADYNALRIIADPKKNASDYYDLLYRAYKNDRDQYSEILDSMHDEGFTDDKIKTNMEKRMKKDAGVTSVKDLPSRWLP